MKPILQALILADHIYEDRATGKKIVAGIFNRVVVMKKPRPVGERRPEPPAPPQEMPSAERVSPESGLAPQEVPGSDALKGFEEGSQVGAGWWVEQSPQPSQPSEGTRPREFREEPARPESPARPSVPDRGEEPTRPAEARRPAEVKRPAEPGPPLQPEEPRRSQEPRRPEEPRRPLEKGRMSIPDVRRAGSPYVYISLTEVQRDIPCILRYVNLDTYEALFEARFPVKSKGPLETLEIVLPVPPIPQIPGSFALELLCDGELVGSHRVLVTESEM